MSISNPVLPTTRWRQRRITTALLVPALILFAGCSKEEIQAKLEEAQTKVESIAETTVKAVEEKLPESGSVKLEGIAAAEASQADLELISIGDGRPSVVQIMTYDPSKQVPSYPAILLHGTTTATSASALAGETVQCDMYFQASYNDPVAMTKPGASVAVSFGALNTEDNALSATLGVVQLVGSNDKPIQINGGDIIAVVREGN